MLVKSSFPRGLRMYGPSSWLVTHLELQARSEAHNLFSGNLYPTQGLDTTNQQLDNAKKAQTSTW